MRLDSDISTNSTAADFRLRRLYVDVRMLFASGIGRYLREVLQRWPALTSLQETYLCNTDEQFDWLRQYRPAGAVERYPAGIYSMREQLSSLRMPRHSLIWVPHYNIPWLARARIVATVHDVAPLALKGVFNRPLQRLAARFYFGAARWKASRVITVSQFSADELQRRLAIPAERVAVVHNGVGSEWFQSCTTEPRHHARLLFVGNLKPHKNLARLIEAINYVRQHGGPILELDVAGKIDGFRTGLEAATVARIRQTPWIRFHGAVTDGELRLLYARASALAFPSFYEGFGLPLLEAMASGCPILAARAASLPEIGGSTYGVRYFDPFSVISIATEINAFFTLSESERLASAAAARDRARQFSWDTTAIRTLSLLQESCAT